MKIIQKRDGNSVNIALKGRLDSLEAPKLEKELVSLIESGVTSVTLDFADLEYITSAGLRVLLGLQQILEESGELRILHVNEDIMNIFEMTGFTEILKIE